MSSSDAPCDEEPSYLNTAWRWSVAKANIGEVHWLGSYQNKTFSGYLTNGYYLENTICFASVCQISVIYNALNITQNNYFYNDSSAQSYGILGMGPESPFWQPYTKSDTHIA